MVGHALLLGGLLWLCRQRQGSIENEPRALRLARAPACPTTFACKPPNDTSASAIATCAAILLPKICPGRVLPTRAGRTLTRCLNRSSHARNAWLAFPGSSSANSTNASKITSWVICCPRWSMAWASVLSDVRCRTSYPVPMRFGAAQRSSPYPRLQLPQLQRACWQICTLPRSHRVRLVITCCEVRPHVGCKRLCYKSPSSCGR